MNRNAYVMKKVLDIVLGVILLIFFSPLMLILAIAVLIDSGLPIIYRQPRMGKDGIPFRIYKFRSMKAGSEEELDEILSKDANSLLLYHEYKKISNDPRITHWGLFTRKYSLDELPQFINVLKGEMSIVGPRPYTLDEIDPQTPVGKKILSVLPGITGWWQVMGRNERTFKERQQLDQDYIDNWSLCLDIVILLRTFGVVIQGTGK